MDAWGYSPAQTPALPGFDSHVSSTIDSDPFYQKVQQSRNTLEEEAQSFTLKPVSSNDEELNDTSTLPSESQALCKFLIACCHNDIHYVMEIATDYPEFINDLSKTGITPLIYAIFFHNLDCIEWLLENGADVDLQDSSLAHYTPLMWAIHLDHLDTVKILFSHGADPYLNPEGTSQNAVSLVYPENNLMYAYFQTHNLLDKKSLKPMDEKDYFGSLSPQEEYFDNIDNKIRLQAVNAYTAELNETDSGKGKDYSYSDSEEQQLDNDPEIISRPDFDYDRLKKDQYLEFCDSDIPSLLDYIFSFRLNSSSTNLQHDTKIPAIIIFQLMRYSHMKVESKELTEFLFDCFLTRIRAITNTTSGVISSDSQSGQGDIVLLSYWLSVIQYLHFYLTKSSIYKNYPKFLQEFINIVQSLIAAISFSINSRLNDLVNECILDFTSLVDVSNALYAKDWNFFKTKKKHPNTYDDIFNMLFPPSKKELMKPSPIRYIQVLGALDYVLKLHQVNLLLRFQVFSQVFYGINSCIFNRIISQSKYCSRVKAIQIRLNLSTIEDWLRSHNYKIYKPNKLGNLQSLLPPEAPALTNILNDGSCCQNDGEESMKLKNGNYLDFYYNSLFNICKIQLLPTIELLEWLQCMSQLLDENDLITTINEFNYLNYFQFVKTMTKLYKYEVDEKKISKNLINFMKKLQNEKGEQQIARNNLHYMSQVSFLSKEHYIYLNPNYIYPVALPNLEELINSYGPGLGGVKIARAKKYQPLLPISVSDDVEELLAANKADHQNETFDGTEGGEHENEQNDEDDDEEDQVEVEEEGNDGAKHGKINLNTNLNGGANSNINGEGNMYHDFNQLTVSEKKNDLPFKGDQIFKELQQPGSLAHKNWGEDDFESNPW